MTMQLTDTERQVLGIVAEYEGSPATVSMISERMRTRHGHLALARCGRQLTDGEIRGLITRLVRKGYLKRDGTEVLRWYTVSSLGRGYLSEEVRT